MESGPLELIIVLDRMEELVVHLRMMPRNVVVALHPIFLLAPDRCEGIAPRIIASVEKQIQLYNRVIEMNKKIVAVDIAKSELVIYFDGSYSIIANESTVIRTCLAQYKINKIDLFAFEATGGYEKKLIECLEEMSLLYRMMHANHIRAYAKALGILVKQISLMQK